MWMRFLKDFDFSPAARGRRVTIAYKAGMTKNVTRECAEAAIAAGKGEKTSVSRSRASEDQGQG